LHGSPVCDPPNAACTTICALVALMTDASTPHSCTCSADDSGLPNDVAVSVTRFSPKIGPVDGFTLTMVGGEL
jgi:hypothetical protein